VETKTRGGREWMKFSTIAQEECMDIILTSGLLNRSDPITNPSSKMILGGRVYSVEAIDKLLNDHATDGEKEEEVDLEEQKYEMTWKSTNCMKLILKL
jgi:hypothetical protein